MANEVTFEVIKDFGSTGDSSWQKHLALVSWNGAEPKYDFRSWNEDMTKCGKGITFTDSEAFDLLSMLEDALGGE